MNATDEMKRAITYSLLAHINNSQKRSNGQLDIFVPIVKQTLAHMAKSRDKHIMGKHISEIGDVALKLSGIKFPIPVLRNILKLISAEVKTEENGFHLHTDDSYIINTYIFADYVDFLQNSKNEINKIQDLFKQFCKINKVVTQEDDLIRFIESNRENLSAYLTQNDDNVSNNITKDYTVEARFVEYFRPLPQVFEKIKDIYIGAILTSYLEYTPSNLKMDVELLFDTNFIVSLLDLNTPESTQTCLQLLKIGKKLGFTFHILADTIEEIQGLLNFKAENFDKSLIQKYVNKEDVYNACIRRRLNKTDLQRISDSIEKTLLDDFQISVIPYTESIRNKAKYSQEYIQLKPHRTSAKSALHDAICIQYVKEKRGNKKITTFDKVNCWWVNNTISHDVENEDITALFASQHDNMSEVIKVDNLLNILWLSSPSIDATTIAEMGLTSLIASTLNKNLPKTRVLKELDENIQKYKNENITERDVFLLSSRIANGQIKDLEKLNGLASADTEAFNLRIKEEADKQEKIEKARAQTLEKLVASLQKEIANIQKSHKELKEEYDAKNVAATSILSQRDEDIKRKDTENQRLGQDNDSYKKEINIHRKEKREIYIKKKVSKWRWRTWWWIIGMGVVLLAFLITSIWAQLNNHASYGMLKLLANNPIISWTGGVITIVIEIGLVVNICSKYDIVKTKEFIEQINIPEELLELK